MKTVIIDNYDSFTYNLSHLVKELGAEVTVLRNDAFQLEELEKFDKIISSSCTFLLPVHIRPPAGPGPAKEDTLPAFIIAYVVVAFQPNTVNCLYRKGRGREFPLPRPFPAYRFSCFSRPRAPLADGVEHMLELALVLTHQHHGFCVIQAHQAQNAFGVSNASLCIVHADIVAAPGRRVHDVFYLSKAGNLHLLDHNACSFLLANAKCFGKDIFFYFGPPLFWFPSSLHCAL